MKRLSKYLPLAALVAPLVTFAQYEDQNFGSLGQALETLQNLLSVAVPLLIGVAVVIFLYGVVAYVIYKGHDTEKQKKAGKFIVMGIVGIFVMVSVWGLVNILVNTFGLDNDIPTDLPQVPEIDTD